MRLAPEKLSRVQIQRNLEALYVVDGDVGLTSLDRSDEGSVESSFRPKILLTPTALLPDAAQVGGEDLPQG